MTWTLYEGDCLEVLASIPDGTVDAVVTDPPYGLDFMGKAWDHGIPGVPFWEAIICTLKPGAYALIFGGTRTYHHLACAVEDAGFEIRDCLMWLYGQGFPKGAACLKPAWEPILLARKPAKRMTPLNVDECRIPLENCLPRHRVPGNGRMGYHGANGGYEFKNAHPDSARHNAAGRYPANVIHDGSDEVMEALPRSDHARGNKTPTKSGVGMWHNQPAEQPTFAGDAGSVARFFYCAKASKAERGEGNNHPTVKPLALMRWLVRLTCPSGGVVLDPFAGSGTTAMACHEEGRDCILVEKELPHCDIIRSRMAEAEAKTATPLFDTKGTP